MDGLKTYKIPYFDDQQIQLYVPSASFMPIQILTENSGVYVYKDHIHLLSLHGETVAKLQYVFPDKIVERRWLDRIQRPVYFKFPLNQLGFTCLESCGPLIRFFHKSGSFITFKIIREDFCFKIESFNFSVLES